MLIPVLNRLKKKSELAIKSGAPMNDGHNLLKSGLPPNEFDGNTTQFLAGIKTNCTIQAFLIPLGIWGGLADEFIHRRIKFNC